MKESSEPKVSESETVVDAIELGDIFLCEAQNIAQDCLYNSVDFGATWAERRLYCVITGFGLARHILSIPLHDRALALTLAKGLCKTEQHSLT